MKSVTWKIGNIAITSITEVADKMAGKMIQSIIPDATKDNIDKIRWLIPNFANDRSELKAVVQTFIVKTPETIVMVDTCIENDKKRDMRAKVRL